MPRSREKSKELNAKNNCKQVLKNTLHFVISRRFSQSKPCISLKMESSSVGWSISHFSLVTYCKEELWGAEDARVVRLVELSVLPIYLVCLLQR